MCDRPEDSTSGVSRTTGTVATSCNDSNGDNTFINVDGNTFNNRDWVFLYLCGWGIPLNVNEV